MTNTEIEEKIKKILEKQDIFKLESVTDINHKPHQFMIGPAHVSYASKHHGGMLGDETLDKAPCAHPGCNLYYKDHSSDKVVFLSLLRDAHKEEVRDVLVPITVIGNGILAGFAFVETEEKFRIKEEDEITNQES